MKIFTKCVLFVDIFEEGRDVVGVSWIMFLNFSYLLIISFICIDLIQTISNLKHSMIIIINFAGNLSNSLLI